jgi:hypothetical protein
MHKQAPERVPQRWPPHTHGREKKAGSASGPAVHLKRNRSTAIPTFVRARSAGDAALDRDRTRIIAKISHHETLCFVEREKRLADLFMAFLSPSGEGRGSGMQNPAVRKRQKNNGKSLVRDISRLASLPSNSAVGGERGVDSLP